jgi:glycosyltransferase involved in cell wall biosynthesis
LADIKRIAIMIYYWPPSGGSGVQRWLFLSNYLAAQGLDISVFVPDNPRIAQVDNTLGQKVHSGITEIKVAGWEPLQHSNKPIGEDLGEKSGILKRFMLWVRANFFIPDARVYWAKAATQIFLKHHKHKPYDLIITSGPPHSLHLIGLQAKQQTGVSWIADFRDPWTGFFQNQSLPLNKRTKQKHKQLEQKVLQRADHVVVTAPSLKEDFEIHNHKIAVLTNGYEQQLPILSVPTTGMVYAGSLKTQQNPTVLWKAIASLIKSNADFCNAFSLDVYGKVATSIKAEVKSLGIDSHVRFLDYQPKELIDTQLTNAKSLLLLGINMPMTANVIHGKLFEYMAAQRPVLGIGPKPSDMQSLFEKHQLGVYVSFDEEALIEKTLIDWFVNNDLPQPPKSIASYERNVIAQEYLDLIRLLT